LLRVEKCAANDYIFRFADPGDAMYFLCTGRVRFVTHDNTGKLVVLEEIKEGDLFGEVAALDSEGRRTADAVAVTDTVLLVLTTGHIKEFLRTCPEVSEYILQRMAKRLASSNLLLRRAQVSVDEVVASTRSREDRALKRLVDFFATMPFLLTNVAFAILWMAGYYLLPTTLRKFLDTDGFDRLSLVLGIDSLLVSILVLMNQAREAKEEGVRDRAEFEATLHADAAINHLHDKVDELATEIRRLHNEQMSHSATNGHDRRS
jgi:CRP-like cAMP-binding protein